MKTQNSKVVNIDTKRLAKQADNFYKDISALQKTAKQKSVDANKSITAWLYDRIRAISDKYNFTLVSVCEAYNNGAEFKVSYGAMKVHKTQNKETGKSGKKNRAKTRQAKRKNPILAIVKKLADMTMTQQAKCCDRLYHEIASEAKQLFLKMNNLVLKSELRAVAKKVKK